MAASRYTVTTTIHGPGTQFDVDAAELERLTELGLIDAIVAVTVPADEVYITDGETPVAPPIGLVWFNRSIP